MLTVAITFTALSLAQPRPPEEEDDPPVGGPDPIVFGLPIDGDFTMLKGFCDVDLQYNATLRQWRSHRAIAIGAVEGTRVVSTFAGRVQSVRNTIYGTTVIVDHENGLSTVFKSLARDTAVNPGDRVEKGQKIGTVGTTSTVEFTTTPHVRVEVLQDGTRIDPNEFIDFGDK